MRNRRIKYMQSYSVRRHQLIQRYIKGLFTETTNQLDLVMHLKHVTNESTTLILMHTSFCRLLPLYFPRDKLEEEIAVSKLPADVGDENGETIIDERKIRIQPLPNLKKTLPRPSQTSTDLSVSNIAAARRLVAQDTFPSPFNS